MDEIEATLRREKNEMLVWTIVGPIIIVLYCVFLVFRGMSMRCWQWWDGAVFFGSLAFMIAVVVLCGQRYLDLSRVTQQRESMVEYHEVHYTKNVHDLLSAAVNRFRNARSSLGTMMYLYEQRGVKPPGMVVESVDECVGGSGSNSAHVVTRDRVLSNFKTHIQTMMDAVTEVHSALKSHQGDYMRWRKFKVMLVILGVSGAAMLLVYRFPQHPKLDDSIKRYFATYILSAAIVGGSVGALLVTPDVDDVSALLKNALDNVEALGGTSIGQFDPGSMDYRMFKQHIRQAGKRMAKHTAQLAALYPGVPSKAARKRIALTGMILSALFIVCLAFGMLVQSHGTFAAGLLCVGFMLVLAISVGL